MKSRNIVIKLFVIVSIFCSLMVQAEQDAAQLDQEFIKRDTELFRLGFNECDLKGFEKYIDEDFEFYHDKGGITESKSRFMEVVKNGICSSEFNPRRELAPNSLNHFPLYENGTLYGAIQKGIHRFYETGPDKNERHTSTAKFTHLWLLKNGEWKLSRVLSYDHVTPNEK